MPKSGNGGEVDYAEKLALLAAKEDDKLRDRLMMALLMRSVAEVSTLRQRLKDIQKLKEV